MTIIPIRALGDPVLKIAARDVEAFDETLARLARDMFETMYDAPGVGLAAPQVGLSLRFFVFDSGQGHSGAVANPVLSEMDGEQEADEGCLSVPGLYFPTVRSAHVRLDGQDLQGRPITLYGDELLARIFQHETDHTDGLLYLDRLDRRERKLAMAELRQRDMAEPPGLSQRG